MQHERRAIDTLRPHPRNYREHSRAQLDAYAESLRTFGQQRPVVILPDGTILSGHGLVEAAKRAGWTELWVKQYDGDNPEGYLIADNRVHDLGADNVDALTDLLSDLAVAGELDGTGYDEDVLCELLTDDGDVAKPRKKHARDGFKIADIMQSGDADDLLAPVEDGDVWQCGRHLWYCGDASAITPLSSFFLDTPRVACVWTDPPYDVEHWARALARAIPASWSPLQDDALLCCAIPSSRDTVVALQAIRDAGWDVAQIACWTYPRATPAAPWRCKHRLFALGGRAGATIPHRDGFTTWPAQPAPLARFYPQIMPQDIVASHVKSLCPEPSVIFDPFAGYGTTMLACDALGHTCLSIEHSIERTRIAIALYEAETGIQAIRVGHRW